MHTRCAEAGHFRSITATCDIFVVGMACSSSLCVLSSNCTCIWKTVFLFGTKMAAFKSCMCVLDPLPISIFWLLILDGTQLYLTYFQTLLCHHPPLSKVVSEKSIEWRRRLPACWPASSGAVISRIIYLAQLKNHRNLQCAYCHTAGIRRL